MNELAIIDKDLVDNLEADQFPRASAFGRYRKCRAAYQLSKRARELGQVAHGETTWTLQGERGHEASELGNGELLPDEEQAAWQKVQQKREAFIKSWADPELGAPTPIKEQRLWLRKGIRLFLSGKPDEVLIQRSRVLVLDQKFGWRLVSEPKKNAQLAVYAVLAATLTKEPCTEVTVQVLSPLHDYEPVRYNPAELQRIYEYLLKLVEELHDPGQAPVPGEQCTYCPARLICQPAKFEAGAVAKLAISQLPTGEKAGRILHEIARAEELFTEIKKYYKTALEQDPEAVTGWRLTEGQQRKWIPDPFKAWVTFERILTIGQFLSTCSVKTAEFTEMISKLEGDFTEPLASVIAIKKTAGSLIPITKRKGLKS